MTSVELVCCCFIKFKNLFSLGFNDNNWSILYERFDLKPFYQDLSVNSKREVEFDLGSVQLMNFVVVFWDLKWKLTS